MTLTIKRGYKSYGGGNTAASAPLQQFFNKLDNRYNAERCLNLDDNNPWNLFPDKGCPAHGVTAVPSTGTCPAPSKKIGDACIYDTEDLMPATSLADLRNADGTPNLHKFFYDASTGMVYFHAAQEFPNVVGPSPLGTCPCNDDKNPLCNPKGQGADKDSSCPNFKKDESYYPCPAQGCLIYRVDVADPDYIPTASNCQVSPSDGWVPPANPYLLAYKGGNIVVRSAKKPGKDGKFPHYATDPPQVCKTSTTQKLNLGQ